MMKKLLEISLGIITGLGGFLEVGSLATSAQAGSEFGFRLLWALGLSVICIIFLVEMSGRLAAVSQHALPDAMRERFGIRFFMVPLVTVAVVSFLTLAAEIGGVSIALQLATGISFRWWAPVVAFVAWLMLWKGTFGFVEKGTSLLGLLSVVFLVTAWKLHPPVGAVMAGFQPSLPSHDQARYWFFAANMIGASVSPYLFYFYSTGAVEDGWDEDSLGVNRITATLGMGFGGAVSAAALIVAAMVLLPRGIRIDHYEQIAQLLTIPLGRLGFMLFIATLAVTCLGAALEISLQTAYLVAQGFGWPWGESLKPRDAARFSLVYTMVIPLGALVMFAGVDVLKLTNVTMALTAVALPVTVIPLLVLMNDADYLGDHGNGWVSNAAVLFVSVIAGVVALAAIPLTLFGG